MERPNIFVIILDAARADYFSCYGFGKKTTPFIDKLASKNTLFSNAYSVAPWTLPSTASLMTGTYHSTHKVDMKNPRIENKNLITLSRFLKEKAGYECYATSANAWVSEETVLKDFDEVDKIWQFISSNSDSFLKIREERKTSKSRAKAVFNALRKGNFITDSINALWEFPFMKKRKCDAKNTNRKIYLRLKSLGEKPFFYYIHYKEPHYPYNPPKKHMKKFMNSEEIRESKKLPLFPISLLVSKKPVEEKIKLCLQKLYMASLSYIDEKLGELFSEINKTGLLDNSIFFITADHGSHFGEHNFFDHLYSLYNPLLHIPLIFISPEGGYKKENRFIQSVDLFPTIAGLLGLKAPNTVEGVNYFKEKRTYCIAQFENSANPIRTLKSKFPTGDFTRLCPKIYSIWDKEYKYINYNNKKEELFNFKNDKGEERNLINKKRKIAEKLKAEYLKMINFSKERESRSRLNLSKETQRALKGLGYF